MLHPTVILLLLLFGGLVVTILVVIHSLARTLLRPPRMTDGKALYVLKRMSPADVGLPFEPISFSVPDAGVDRSIDIAAWWIDASSDQTCILIHGYGDAKVGALAWAPTWHQLGWNLLVIDLRAHGESGGILCTGGVHERDDVDAVLNQLRQLKPSACNKLVLCGVSLGAAVALAVAARRDDLHGVVADSVFADYADAARVHGRLIGAPLPSMVPLVVKWAQKQAGVNFADARPIDSIPRIACPVMLIHGGADRFVPDDAVARLAAALASRHNAADVHSVVEDAGHCLAIVADPIAYANQLRAFLSR